MQEQTVHFLTASSKSFEWSFCILGSNSSKAKEQLAPNTGAYEASVQISFNLIEIAYRITAPWVKDRVTAIALELSVSMK